MSNQAQFVVAARDVLGESPWWSERVNSLSWLDVRKGCLRTLNLDDGSEPRDLSLPHESTAVVGDDGFLIVGANGISKLDPNAGALPLAVTAPWFEPAVARTNDATTDRSGRVWVGWLQRDRAVGRGAIGVAENNNVEIVIDDLTMPNGLGWLSDGRTLVFADTGKQVLARVRIDLETKMRAGSPEVIASIPASVGLADGLAVDEDDCIWLAIWGAGRVHRYSPAGKLLEAVCVPAPLITSCAFGGPSLRDLYITSARVGIADPTPFDGALFVYQTQTAGLQVFPYASSVYESTRTEN